MTKDFIEISLQGSTSNTDKNNLQAIAVII